MTLKNFIKMNNSPMDEVEPMEQIEIFRMIKYISGVACVVMVKGDSAALGT